MTKKFYNHKEVFGKKEENCKTEGRKEDSNLVMLCRECNRTFDFSKINLKEE